MIKEKSDFPVHLHFTKDTISQKKGQHAFTSTETSFWNHAEWLSKVELLLCFLTRTTLVTTATLQIVGPQMSECVSALRTLKKLSSEQLLVGSQFIHFMSAGNQICFKSKIYSKDIKLYRRNYLHNLQS